MCVDGRLGGSYSLLRHDAFVYDSDDEFVREMARFVRAGQREGAAAIAVTSCTNWALLRDALGRDSEHVSFTDRDEWYLRPAGAVNGYLDTLRDALADGTPSVRVIGEVQFGATPEEWGRWTAYEAVLNRALADQPAWVVCPYDARALPDRVVEDAWRTHHQVLSGGWQANRDYDDPARVVRDFTPEQDPLRQFLAG
jgi:hypothetical protein